MIEQIILTGNCYWCLEAVFKNVKGITKVESGKYNISDYAFAFGKNDKLEAIRVTYDLNQISLDTLFNIYYIAHTPVLIKWDKEDCFYPMCRPAVFYTTEEQRQAIEKKIKELNTNNTFGSEVQTKVALLLSNLFVLVDEKDQDYFAKNPNDAYCVSIVRPKLDKLQLLYKDKLVNK